MLLPLLLLLYVLYHVLIPGREAPPITTYKVHTAEAAAEAVEAAASISVLAILIRSMYEKLSNELPTYQVLPLCAKLTCKNTSIHTIAYGHVRTFTDVYGQCFGPYSIVQT